MGDQRRRVVLLLLLLEESDTFSMGGVKGCYITRNICELYFVVCVWMCIYCVCVNCVLVKCVCVCVRICVWM